MSAGAQLNVKLMVAMRLVIKVGTSLIAPGGSIDTVRMRALVDQLEPLRHEYLIVTSGAIASGMSNLGLSKRPATVPLMQACAAVGQSVLMNTYERLFFGKKVVAQLLLSSDDFTSPVRYKNLQNALHELLKLGVVPIVNENDSVSVRELVGAFGDNDELSALLATAVKADWLLLADRRGWFLRSEWEAIRVCCVPCVNLPRKWKRCAMAKVTWALEACVRNCALQKPRAKRE